MEGENISFDELTSEETVYIEGLSSRLKRMVSIFWFSVIILFFAININDRILTAIFSDIEMGFLPYVNHPPYYVIWSYFGFSTTFPFVLSLIWFYWKYASNVVKVAVSGVLTVYMCGMMFFTENWVLDYGVTFWEFFPIMWVLLLALTYGSFFMCTKMKTSVQKIGLLVIYALLFVVIHQWVYLPLFPNFSWIGVGTTDWSASDVTPVLVSILVGIIMLAVMMILGFESVRKKIVAHEIKEKKGK